MFQCPGRLNGCQRRILSIVSRMPIAQSATFIVRAADAWLQMSMRSDPVRVMLPISVKFAASPNGAALDSSSTTSRLCAPSVAPIRPA